MAAGTEARGPAERTRWRAWAALPLGVAAVGLIDHLTGADIHVVALYFVPLAWASARLGLRGGAVAALLCTLAWTAAQYSTGIRPATPSAWLVNFCTQGAAFATVAFLVARLSEALRRERQRAQTDALTGLRNRQAFLEQAAGALALCRRHARPVALACIDLDGFKRLNERAGHAAGDELLRSTARTMGWALRASDIAARTGSDEFAVFLPETADGPAQALMERLRDALESSEAFQAAALTASIGLSCDPAARRDVGELLKQADLEMASARRAQRRGVSVQRWNV
jgi:diguanylate cyclase (GGDEF)-like protein